MITSLVLALALNLVLAALSLFQHKQLKLLNKEWARESRRHSEVIANLLDRLMHATGQTWTPPPRPVADEEVIDEELKNQLEGWREV